MNRILYLDNSIANDVYQPSVYWKVLFRFPFDSYRASAGELPLELDNYSHILITGSSASVLDDKEWMRAEAELIRTAVEKGKVILGSCFGHQILAKALFGMKAVRSRQIPEVGWPDITIIAEDHLFGYRGRVIKGFVFHFDDVCNLPEKEATIIARSMECGIMGFKLKNRPVWGMQPHLEMGIVEGLKLIENVFGEGEREKLLFFNSPQTAPQDTGWIIPLMNAFHEARPRATG